MVNNPIYDGDGPVYEGIRPQYETPTAVILQATDTSNNDANTVRYVDQPVRLSQVRSQSFIHHTVSNVDAANVPNRSHSVSMPAARAMALKRNGQERNKLRLTLSLQGGSDSGTTTGSTGIGDMPDLENPSLLTACMA